MSSLNVIFNSIRALIFPLPPYRCLMHFRSLFLVSLGLSILIADHVNAETEQWLRLDESKALTETCLNIGFTRITINAIKISTATTLAWKPNIASRPLPTSLQGVTTIAIASIQIMQGSINNRFESALCVQEWGLVPGSPTSTQC
jgi:hypothetical protein